MINKKIIYFLGSGASIDFFPGVKKITEAVLAWDTYKEPPSDMSLGNSKVIVEMMANSSKSDVKTYFKGLYDVLKYQYGDPSNFLNFERLIHIATLIDANNCDVDSGVIDKYKHPLAPFIDFVGEGKKYNRKFINGMVATSASNYILDYIAGFVNNPLTKKLRESFLNKFIYLATQVSTPRVFSLNYDIHPLYADVEFKTGFKKFEGREFEYFSYKEVKDLRQSNAFCQLHGSILFSCPPTDSINNVLLQPFIRYTAINDAVAARETIRRGMESLPDGTSRVSDFMITGMRKADDILVEPYASYFHFLEEELFSTNKWILVGYGGRDRHVNMIIRRAMKSWEERKEKLKILCVSCFTEDPFSDEIVYFHAGHPFYKDVEDLYSLFSPSLHKKLQSSRGFGMKIFKSKLNLVETEVVDYLLSVKGTEATFGEHQDEILHFFEFQ